MWILVAANVNEIEIAVIWRHTGAKESLKQTKVSCCQQYFWMCSNRGRPCYLKWPWLQVCCHSAYPLSFWVWKFIPSSSAVSLTFAFHLKINISWHFHVASVECCTSTCPPHDPMASLLLYWSRPGTDVTPHSSAALCSTLHWPSGKICSTFETQCATLVWHQMAALHHISNAVWTLCYM